MEEPMALGTLARCFCGVKRAQVEEAAQAKGEGLLGAALVRMGFITEQQLVGLLARQWAMRNGLASRADVNQLVDFAARGALKNGGRWAEMLQDVSALLATPRTLALAGWPTPTPGCQ